MILAGHALARALKAMGIPWVAGVSGESFLPLLDGLRDVGLPFVSTVHEAGAVFLAGAYARATGSTAIVAVTRGPGAANALIGVHEAWQARAPIVVMVGQVESAVRGRDVLQEMEVSDVFRSTAKAVHEVGRPDRLVSSVIAGVRESQLGGRGPVLVSVPSDIFYGKVEEAALPGHLPIPGAIGVLSDSQLRDVVTMIATSRRGLLVPGPEFANGRAAASVREVARLSGLGVIGGHAFPDVLDSGEAQFLGVSTVRSSPVLRAALQESDLIIAVGHRLADRTTQGYLKLRGRLLAIDGAPSVGWDEYPETEFITADPAAAVAQLCGSLMTSPASEGLAERAQWVAAKRRALDAESVVIQAEERGKASGVSFAAVLSALDRSLPSGSSIVSDAGTFNDWVVRFLPFRDGRTYHGPLSGAMGFGLGAALGVQLARNDPRTVVMTGDGGFLMTGLELSTAVRLSLPITVVLFNNHIWGSIALHQDRNFPGNRFAVDLPSVSFAGLARAMGAEGFLVTDPATLEGTLSRALRVKGPALIEIMTDPRRPSPVYYEPSPPGDARSSP